MPFLEGRNRLLTRSQSDPKSKHNCRFSNFLIGSIIILILCSFSYGYSLSNANAQTPPLIPPPTSFSSSNNNNHNYRIAPNDTTPPKVEIISKEFTEGNNQFVAIITDESDLRSITASYVENGDIVSSDLIKDKGDQYFALVKLTPPSAIIDLEVTDAANNTASIAQEYKVNPKGNFFDQLLAWFRGVLSNF